MQGKVWRSYVYNSMIFYRLNTPVKPDLNQETEHYQNLRSSIHAYFSSPNSVYKRTSSFEHLLCARPNAKSFIDPILCEEQFLSLLCVKLFPGNLIDTHHLISKFILFRQPEQYPSAQHRQDSAVLLSWRFSTSAGNFHDDSGLGAHEQKQGSSSFSGWLCARPLSNQVPGFLNLLFHISSFPKEKSQPACLSPIHSP